MVVQSLLVCGDFHAQYSCLTTQSCRYSASNPRQGVDLILSLLYKLYCSQWLEIFSEGYCSIFMTFFHVSYCHSVNLINASNLVKKTGALQWEYYGDQGSLWLSKFGVDTRIGWA